MPIRRPPKRAEPGGASRIAALQRRIAELEQGAARLHTLDEAAQLFTAAALDLDALLRTIAQAGAAALGDLCVVRPCSPDRATLLPGYGAHRDPAGLGLAAAFLERAYPSPELPMGQVALSGQPALIAATDQPYIATFPPEFGPYLERFGISSLVMVPLRANGRSLGCIALARSRGGAPYTPADQALLQDLADRAAFAVAHARALAEAQEARALAEQAARATAATASQRADRLQAVTAALAGALSREAVIQVMTEHGTAATGAVAAVVSVVDPTGQHLEIIGGTGRSASELAPYQTMPLSAMSPPAVAARSGQAIWLPSRSDAEAHFPGATSVMAQFGDHAYAALPLLSAKHLLGTVSFSYRTPNAFGADERAFLLNLAGQCAQALERAQLYAEVLAGRTRLQALSERLIAAQEEERRHLARELHDEIGQALTGLSLVLAMGPSLPHARLLTQLEEAQRQIATLIAQVRRRSLDLRPAMLDDLGLRPALSWYLARYSEQTGIALDVQLPELDVRLLPLVELTAYRIVQEALTNVARHAGVQAAGVAVWVAAEQLLIEVIDAGSGFDVEAVWQAHASSGLPGMRERAMILGGEITIESAPGAGTRLFANLPTAQPAAEGEEA